MTTADELAKLAQLKEQGALSEEEFQKEKQALLARSQQAAQPKPPGSRRQMSPEQAQKAQKLLLWSRILGWGGIGMLFIGAPTLGLGVNGVLGGVAAVIGIAGAITGAVLGQIGRGMQGRAI
jgi:hypothetical protein